MKILIHLVAGIIVYNMGFEPAGLYLIVVSSMLTVRFLED